MNFETLTAATVDQVWAALDAQVEPGPVQELAIEQALGCALARDVYPAQGFPPFDRATMDGYALRSADVPRVDTRLRLAGLVRTGGRPPPLEPGTCVRINTGAPVPAGADAVIMVEKCSEAGPDLIQMNDTIAPGKNIDPQGSLLKKEDLLARAGTRVHAGSVLALAAGGISRVTVHRPPRVALLSTGEEVIEIGQELDAGQIYDSNGITLAELIRQAGGTCGSRGRCPDEAPVLRPALEHGLTHDLCCAIGGMSKGTHDLVPALLEEMGVRWLIRGLHLKPGRPMRIGRAPSGCWVVGFPGNPLSCMVCFFLFVRGLLGRMQGLPRSRPDHASGILEADVTPGGDRPTYRPARWSAGPEGGIRVAPLTWRGSGDPFSLASANALVYRPERAPAAWRGETVTFAPLEMR